MIFDDVVFLAGFTARSRAYVQGLVHANLLPGLTIAYGDPTSDRPGQGVASLPDHVPGGGVFLPDPSIPLVETLSEGGLKHRVLEQESVNDQAVVELLGDLSPDVIIFSGYGGEIVREEALSTAPFLHVHSGWLPDYRGSTTGYYSWLEEGRLGASAILLERKIDQGPILARQRYPLPPEALDMDHVWDSAIRADLLVKVLDTYANEGELPDGSPQRGDEGRTFYVIHPVLKHIALCAR